MQYNKLCRINYYYLIIIYQILYAYEEKLSLILVANDYYLIFKSQIIFNHEMKWRFCVCFV
jgi:hypothetical protein